MNKIHDSLKYEDIKSWAADAIAREDKTFDNQMWPGERTREEDDFERCKRIKLLRKYRLKEPVAKIVAKRLKACEYGSRCDHP